MHLAPHPLASHIPQPSKLDGDLLDIAEMSFECQSEDAPPAREILVMTVDLGRGRRDRLVVCEGDSPRSLGRRFCLKHGLSEKLADALATSIRANLDQVAAEADSSLAQSYDAEEEDEQIETQRMPKPFSHAYFHSHPRNAGDRLYSQAIATKGSKALQALKSRQESQQEVERELTFTPQVQRPFPARSEESTWQQQLIIKRDIDVKRREKAQIQTAESQEIERNRSREWGSRFEVLYQQASVRKAKAERASEDHFASTCPFRPDIPSSPASESLESRIDRLYSSRRHTNAQLDLERIRRQRQVNAFRPHVGRPPTAQVTAIQRDPQVPIGDYLHLRTLARQQQTPTANSVSDFLASKSESDRLYEKLKIQCFRDIFDALRPSLDTELSADSCLLDRLRPELAAIIDPLVEELRQMGECLDFEEFCASMENLLKVLTPTERAIVLRRTSKPTSAQSSVGRRKQPRASSPNLLTDLPFYERAMMFRKVPFTQLQEDRLTEAKAATESLVTSQCPFRPSLAGESPAEVKKERRSDGLAHTRGSSLR